MDDSSGIGSSPPDLNGVFAEERRLLIQHLQQLRHATDSIETRGFSALAFGDIAAAVRFISFQFRIHIENEETAVFPSMEQYLTTLLLLLKNEHKELQELSARLMVAVHNIESGRVHGNSARELVNTIEMLIGLTEKHIEKEEEAFFPFVKQFLSPEEYERMMRLLFHSNRQHNAQNKSECRAAKSVAA